MIGRAHAERLSRYLEMLDIEHEVKVYDDAGHSFMTEGHHPIGKLVYLPMHLGYAPNATADAWRRAGLNGTKDARCRSHRFSTLSSLGYVPR